jgi:hypothetical protein
MATGDHDDMFGRLKGLLPAGWFTSGQTPNLDALVHGIAALMSQVYAMVAYAMLQTRINTATDGWLDLYAADFFGSTYQRRPAQSDVSFRAQIMANLFRERGTRGGVIKLVQDMTGHTPTIIEMGMPSDTGAYSRKGGYGRFGAYGSQSLPPGTFIVKAKRPDPGSLQAGTLDADILAGIDSVRPVTATAWIQLQ